MMHGLMNRAIQSFVRDTYGETSWQEIIAEADLGFDEFEAMLHYEGAETERVLEVVSGRLSKSRSEVLEDIGTYLVSHPNMDSLRRLLRFGGVNYVDFLHSLDDLPDRTRLAVSDLILPRITLRQLSAEHFVLRVTFTEQTKHLAGFGHVLVGLLRSMADDYGALVFLEFVSSEGNIEQVDVTLVEAAFSEGRSFDLSAQAG